MTTRRKGCAKRLTARADRFDLFRNKLDLPLSGRVLLAAVWSQPRGGRTEGVVAA